VSGGTFCASAGESAKINAAQLGGGVVEHVINSMIGKDEKNGVADLFTPHKLGESFIAMALPLGIAEIPAGLKHSSNFRETIYDAGLHPWAYKANIEQAVDAGIITQEQANSKIQVVNTMADLVANTPELSPINGQRLNHNQRVEYSYNKAKEIAIKAKLEIAKGDKPLSEIYEKQIADLQKERADILNGGQQESIFARQPDGTGALKTDTELAPTQSTEASTPAKKEIHKLGILAGQITLIIIAIIFVFELLVHRRPIVDNILFATSIAVAAVPEGLPAVITIALALGVQRLSRKNAIIKQLSSVETLGATTVICTDKTGTLTKNEMVVTEALIDDFYVKFSGIGYEPKGKYQIFTNKDDTFEITNNQITAEFIHKHNSLANPLRWMSLCATLCNNANLSDKDGVHKVLGDPTEGGLLSMGYKINLSVEQEAQENWQEVHELPFDSTRKMMSKIFLDRKQNKYYVFSKGAPENIIHASDQRLHLGRLNILTKGVKEELMSINEKFNENALRTIGLAYKEISAHELANIINQKEFDSKVNAIEKKLTFIGIAGLSDPPRPEIKEAVHLTQVAGIRSYIITGDNGFTTAAIAKQVGLINDKKPYEIINGNDLENISDQELKSKFSNHNLDIIFARSKPEHKLRLVSLLKEINEVVAVTGDGVNDAPALKRADIGVAMGITGSDVSKEAANMVLMDDSFSTIVTAIEEGRVIFANLKKFIFYIFSSNIGEVFTIFLALIIGLEAPLSAILILTINFATDLFPALALGVEPAEKNIMKLPPRQADQKLMTTKFLHRILFTGCVIGLLVLLLYISRLILGGWTYGQAIDKNLYLQASSLAFIAMVMFQVTNSFNAKTENDSIFKANFFNNPKLIWANLSSVIIAVIIVELPFLQTFFRTSSLSLIDWGLILAGCILITIILELEKYQNRRKNVHNTTKANA
jgi:Ca2+-transporting ATPase